MAVCVGCGLTVDANGVLAVDPCLNGGILCGETADDAEDNCIYVNVQGQGNAACVPLADAQNCANDSPNCNGLVRTCEGLWAPPKTRMANSDCTPAVDVGYGVIQTIDQILFPIGNTADLPGAYQQDLVLANSPGDEVQFWTAQRDECYPTTGMTFGKSSVPGFFVRPDEVWRFTLFERLGFRPNATTDLSGTIWARQDEVIIDGRGFDQDTYVKLPSLNDISDICAGTGSDFIRGEMMTTGRRLVGAGPLNNSTILGLPGQGDVGSGNRQYRFLLFQSCRLPVTTGTYNI